jgi:hypothetical protein
LQFGLQNPFKLDSEGEAHERFHRGLVSTPNARRLRCGRGSRRGT